MLGRRERTGFWLFSELEHVIADRKINSADDKSYVASLFRAGINKIAQKVGEEAVETVIEAKDDNDSLFLNESADLLFHYLILLQAKGFTLTDIEKVLLERKKTDFNHFLTKNTCFSLWASNLFKTILNF